MNKILPLIIISLLPILTVIILASIPEPLTMDEFMMKPHTNYLYVEQNVNHGFTEREYSAVMRLANDDIKKTIEIFNDPDYPEKFYDHTGFLP